MVRLLAIARGARSAALLPLVFAAYTVVALAVGFAGWSLIRSLLP